MQLRAFYSQLWMSQRSAILLLTLLIVANLVLLVVLEQWLVPQVADRESSFLRRQAEVRQLLRQHGGEQATPEQQYELAYQDLVKFQQSLPEYRDFTALIEELEVLSGRAGLNIAQISYEAKELQPSSMLQVNLSFNVLGSYTQTKKFIHSLEQSVRLITIEQISLRGVNDDGVNLRLNLETFFWSGSRDS